MTKSWNIYIISNSPVAKSPVSLCGSIRFCTFQRGFIDSPSGRMTVMAIHTSHVWAVWLFESAYHLSHPIWITLFDFLIVGAPIPSPASSEIQRCQEITFWLFKSCFPILTFWVLLLLNFSSALWLFVFWYTRAKQHKKDSQKTTLFWHREFCSTVHCNFAFRFQLFNLFCSQIHPFPKEQNLLAFCCAEPVVDMLCCHASAIDKARSEEGETITFRPMIFFLQETSLSAADVFLPQHWWREHGPRTRNIQQVKIQC